VLTVHRVHLATAYVGLNFNQGSSAKGEPQQKNIGPPGSLGVGLRVDNPIPPKKVLSRNLRKLKPD
jgi:hypothetical protein